MVIELYKKLYNSIKEGNPHIPFFMNNLENIKNETSIETNNFANWNPDVRQQFLSKRTPKNHRVCYISYTEERKT